VTLNQWTNGYPPGSDRRLFVAANDYDLDDVAHYRSRVVLPGANHAITPNLALPAPNIYFETYDLQRRNLDGPNTPVFWALLHVSIAIWGGNNVISLALADDWSLLPVWSATLHTAVQLSHNFIPITPLKVFPPDTGIVYSVAAQSNPSTSALGTSLPYYDISLSAVCYPPLASRTRRFQR